MQRAPYSRSSWSVRKGFVGNVFCKKKKKSLPWFGIDSSIHSSTTIESSRKVKCVKFILLHSVKIKTLYSSHFKIYSKDFIGKKENTVCTIGGALLTFLLLLNYELVRVILVPFRTRDSYIFFPFCILRTPAKQRHPSLRPIILINSHLNCCLNTVYLHCTMQRWMFKQAIQ